MEEGRFGFSYDANDIRPIRALWFTMLATQLVGAVLGWWFKVYPEWPNSLWFGALAAMFPGFLVGLFVQAMLSPDTLREHSAMVWRIGLCAALISLMAVYFEPSDFV